MHSQFVLDPELTNKDDTDPILEYKNIDTSDFPQRRVYLGKIPFYQATLSDLVAHTIHTLDRMREKKAKSSGEFGPQLVLPFDPYRYVWVRFRRRMLQMAEQAFINLPDGAGMLFMAKVLGRPIPELVFTVSYTVNLIRIAHAKDYSLFLLGSRDEVLEKLCANLRRSFKGLRIVGRHHGYLDAEAAFRVREAVRKTDPHILLVGMGYHRSMKWIAENRQAFGDLVLVNAGGTFEVLAGMRRKAPPSLVVRGYTWLWRAINRPYRWHRILIAGYWFLETLALGLFRRVRGHSR
ncbi:MAG: WecB/TagA/CpsF family glycosyltransferase [Turneriella sp.]|nr:WecB/TagA/CpsF family glycosyltransferase [Turneriella sp.]